MNFDLAVIGGGVIGVEMASVYSAFGCRVTILDLAGRLLPTMDRELGQRLAAALKKQGVTVTVRAAVQQITQTEGGLLVQYADARGNAAGVRAEGVLIATGRRPAAGSLFIGAYRPDIERGGILADAAGRTSLPHLYVIGDARAGNIQLAHLAEAQGKNAVAAILGRPLPVDTSLVPACVYTDPEIASVGMTKAGAKAAGIPVRCGKALSGANGRCAVAGTSAGFIKLVCGADTGRLLGAQLCWPRATDLTGELALAVQRGLTAADLTGLIPPTPPLPRASAPPQSRPRGLHETHVQAAADRTAGETFTREMRPLARIHDNYEKIILAAGRLTHNKSTCTGTASAVVPYRCFCCLQACAHSGRRRKATSCPLMSWACRQKKTRLLQSGRSSC